MKLGGIVPQFITRTLGGGVGIVYVFLREGLLAIFLLDKKNLVLIEGQSLTLVLTSLVC